MRKSLYIGVAFVVVGAAMAQAKLMEDRFSATGALGTAAQTDVEPLTLGFQRIGERRASRLEPSGDGYIYIGPVKMPPVGNCYATPNCTGTPLRTGIVDMECSLAPDLVRRGSQSWRSGKGACVSYQ